MRDERPSIMVVDADPESLASQYRMLTDRGFRVATYLAPEPACGYAAEEKPEAILMHLGLHEASSVEMLRRLKEASAGSHLLLFADSGSLPYLREARRVGAEILLPDAQGADAVVRHLEDAIGERSLP